MINCWKLYPKLCPNYSVIANELEGVVLTCSDKDVKKLPLLLIIRGKLVIQPKAF